MYKDQRIAVVIPAYNVEHYIQEVVRSIRDFVDHIIVVDDASQDRTYEVCKNIEDPRLIVLRNPKNLGVGGGTIEGFKLALKLNADVMIKMDGDGQMDPLYLKKLIDPLVTEGYHYTKGNRFLHSHDLEKMPKIRLFGNFSMTFLTKLVSGYWNIFDPQNGYVAIRGETFRDLDPGRISKRFFFENDMLVHLNVFNRRVKDVPIPAIYDAQPSSLKIHRVLFSFPVYLFRRFWYRVYQKYVLRDFSPIALLIVFGLILTLWSTFYGGRVWWRSLHTGVPATTGTVMLAVLPFLIGFEMLLQALILDIHQTPK